MDLYQESVAKAGKERLQDILDSDINKLFGMDFVEGDFKPFVIYDEMKTCRLIANKNNLVFTGEKTINFS